LKFRTIEIILKNEASGLLEKLSPEELVIKFLSTRPPKCLLYNALIPIKYLVSGNKFNSRHIYHEKFCILIPVKNKITQKLSTFSLLR
jgi:hypothetical protein